MYFYENKRIILEISSLTLISQEEVIHESFGAPVLVYRKAELYYI